ncbi:MAG: aldo/keto reductase [Candidatus Hodarchaeales archaeon]|jgi:aryl-alcohol dehydrogenase-like predicted oxidoreductase
MKYRNMGKHGIKLSEVSIGTMYHGSYYSRETSHSVLSEAVNQDINFIDCADRYGIEDSDLPMDQRTRAEQILGDFMAQNANRDDLVISSKVFKKLRRSVNSGGLSRKHIRESIRDSLHFLQTDYLDIYYCHRADRETPLEETIRTMTNLIDEGLVHYWGTSWWPPFIVERAIGIAKAHGLIPPAVEEPPYHINARFIEIDLFDTAEYHGLGITSFEALATGFYTGKYLDEIPKGSRGADITPYPQEIIDKRRNQLLELTEVAKSLEISLSQLILAWSLRNPLISSTIMGASKNHHVIENAGASGIELKPDVQEKMEEILNNKPSSEYRINDRP